MTDAARIPATIITGFLGAGKTTLVRHLLETARGRRLAIIVNEFGSVGVDGEVLKSCGIESCPEENIVELANGCLCCTVAEDFIPTMQALIDRDVPPEHILIETSGLALPKPLVKAFNWPSIRSRLTVDGVVAVVDAPGCAVERDPLAAGCRRDCTSLISVCSVFSIESRCGDARRKIRPRRLVLLAITMCSLTGTASRRV